MQGQGAAQYVGRQVEVVSNAFGRDASFSDFDLGHPGEPDPWRLAANRPGHAQLNTRIQYSPTATPSPRIQAVTMAGLMIALSNRRSITLNVAGE